MEIVKAIEATGSGNGATKVKTVISDCGQLWFDNVLIIKSYLYWFFRLFQEIK